MDEVIRRLYALPPEQFVAARDEAAHHTRDSKRAAQIVKLRKPTQAAWMVNLLAIKRPDLLADLAQLAAALREAQRELRGAQLRELSAQRRATVSALVEEARRLAVEAKPALGRGALPLGEVEQTLQAALADPQAAELVRSGQLVKSIEYAGFGEVPKPQLRLITGGSTVERETAPVVDRRAAQRELAAARGEHARAEKELERAVAAEREGARTLAELERELAELQQRRALADEELGRRKLARKTAERAVAAARRRLGEAQAAVETARTKGRTRTG
ncbi:MAG: hypothetical protein FWJ93_05425 [Micromonosporaceae bacterium]